MDLRQNAFFVLGATTRDDRRRIVELAEKKSLLSDEERVREARSTLTHPMKRLAAEVAWLPGMGPTLVLSAVRGERVALHVDRIAGQQQIYVKPPPDLLSNVRAVAGLTILGDGRPVFLLDLNQLA